MRVLVLLLIALNLALLALGWWMQQPQPAIALNDWNADKIRLLDATPLPVTPTGVTSPNSPNVALPPATPNPMSGATGDVQADLVCLQWGPFTADVAQRAGALLDSLQPPVAHSQSSAGALTRYWVMVPPAASLAEAQARVGRLRQKGVEEFQLLREDPEWRNAISLGLFYSRDAAQRRLAEVEEKGVIGARLRERTDGEVMVNLLVRVASPEQRRNVNAQVGAFGGTVLNETPCS